MTEETLFDAEETMKKLVAACTDDLIGLWPGHASTSAFARLEVDYNGVATQLPQLATVNVPEARIAFVKPYDTSLIGPIGQAIRDSDLGLEPTSDGTTVRVHFPQLTAQRRQELVRVAKTRGEDTKALVRSAGEHASETIAKLLAEGKIADDHASHAETVLRTLTNTYVDSIDKLVRNIFG